MSDAQIIDLFRKNLCGKYYFDSMDTPFKINVHINTRAILFQNDEVYSSVILFHIKYFMN